MGYRTETARDLIDLIGIEAAGRFCEAFGGFSLPFPKGPDNNRAGAARFEAIAETVGHEAALVLIRRYAGDTVYIPSGKQIRHQLAMRRRNRRIVADYEAGVGMFELVQRYQLCDRRISQILNTPIPPDRAE